MSVHDNLIARVKKKLTQIEPMEWAFLLFLIIISAYMFSKSYDYVVEIARFPRFIALGTLIGSLLVIFSLLFRETLPEAYVRAFLESSDETLGGEFKQEAKDSSEEQEVELRVNLSPISFTLIAMIGFGLLSFLIGLLWSTPIFIVIYLIWFNKPWYHAVVLALLGFLVVYGFMEVLNVPVHEGILFPP